MPSISFSFLPIISCFFSCVLIQLLIPSYFLFLLISSYFYHFVLFRLIPLRSPRTPLFLTTTPFSLSCSNPLAIAFYIKSYCFSQPVDRLRVCCTFSITQANSL